MANHDWQMDICPECGEETATNKVRPFIFATYCPHCQWSSVDDPLAGLTKKEELLMTNEKEQAEETIGCEHEFIQVRNLLASDPPQPLSEPFCVKCGLAKPEATEV